MSLPDRVTDCSTDQLGEGNQFLIRPSSDGTHWIVFAAWESTDVTEYDYDARGTGETIELAMTDAVDKLSSDEYDDE